MNNATWMLQAKLGEGVYPMKPLWKTWWVDPRTCNLPIQRYGYALAVDFGGTAHSYQGATLAANINDLLDYEKPPQAIHALTSYVSFSRVRVVDNTLLVQTYAPSMFQRGTPVGPCLLMERLRGHLKTEDM